MTTPTPHGLSEAQVDHFIEHGFVRLDGVFGPELARRGRDELWTAMGLSPARPETWTRPVTRVHAGHQGMLRVPSSWTVNADGVPVANCQE